MPEPRESENKETYYGSFESYVNGLFSKDEDDEEDE